jgi:hypothetical protein
MDQLLDVNSLNNQSHSDPAEISGTEPRGSAETDDDDVEDDVSRVSDITEDRTQRQIDDDLAERRKILLAYVNKTYSNKTGGRSPNTSMSNASNQRQLDTIETMFPRENVESRSGETVDSNGSSRLSVAQRARLEAESRSNVHRSPTPAQRNSSDSVNPPTRDDSSMMSAREGSIRSLNSVATNLSRTDTVGRTGSFFKNIGRAIEKAVDSTVLGISSDNESYGDETETQSEIVSSVVSDASVNVNSCST